VKFVKTPICDFVKSYVNDKKIRFHMPGHKGTNGRSYIESLNAFDITEIEGADYLYEPRGIISESEKIAAAVYGVPHTFYSTEGSSLCIKAMLSLAAGFASGNADQNKSGNNAYLPENGNNADLGKSGGRKIIALTNAHRAFSDGCKLLGLTPVWIEDPSRLEDALRGYPDAAAVFLTSPDYLGNMIPMREISKLVREKYGRLLLHDCAHGAYLFLSDDREFTDGADLVCTSAHKSLPVLTGGAYLHVNNEKFAPFAAAAMKPFASTSPSYLALQSLDMCNKTVSGESYKKRLKNAFIKTAEIKKTFGIDTEEPLKICFRPGGDIRRVFDDLGIVPEIMNDDLIVLMVSAENTDEDFAALRTALSKIEINRADKKRKIEFIYTE
jgi:arginine/lysine/ornithine decarboxylase